MDLTLRKRIEEALAEDIGPGDITTDALVGPEERGAALILAKEPLTIAGLAVAEAVFRAMDPEVAFLTDREDGDAVEAGQTLVRLRGRMRGLLKAERTALNYLQRLSGIATLSRRWSEALEGTGARLVDTRKTTPGWRVLEKYAVRVGGAFNHRMGLFDGALIKDNHIAACGGIEPAVERARRRISHLLKIEVEASTLEEARQALSAGADVIMFDNMDIETIREAVALVNGGAVTEVSGNVRLENLRELAAAGVDIISAGALTHSARSVDISMKITHDTDT